MIVAVSLWGTAIAVFGLTDTLWLSLALLAVAGWADVISAVVRNTILQSSIPERFRSRMSSIQMAVVQGGPRLGDLESGAVATRDQRGVRGRLGRAGLHRRRRDHRRDHAGVPTARGRCGRRRARMIRRRDRQTFVRRADLGRGRPGVFARIVVVSPHFDDAAMGAGHLLASYDDTTVVTVLGGRPPAYPAEPSEWDALGGFVAGDDVVAVRREEDVAAMAVLESGYRWLDFPDHQYLAPRIGPTPYRRRAGARRRHRRARPHRRLLPHGPGQPGPRHDARRLPVGAARSSRTATWFCYEDHGYKHLPGPAGLAGGQAAALAAVADAGHRAARARRGPQAPGHLVLHVADRRRWSGTTP